MTFSAGHCSPSRNHVLYIVGKSRRLVPLLFFLLRPGHREAKSKFQDTARAPEVLVRCSREKSLVLPTHGLHRAPGALAEGRENLIRTDRQVAPGRGCEQ